MFGLSKEEQKLKKRLKNLDYVNHLIQTRELELVDTVQELERVQEELASVKEEYQRYFTMLDMAKNIVNIEQLRKRLEEERKELQTLKNSVLPTKDILFGIYTYDDLDEEDENKVSECYEGKYMINIFHFVDRISFDVDDLPYDVDDDEFYDEALVYQSLNGDLTAMYSMDLLDPIFDNVYDTEKYRANVEMSMTLTFSEVCMMLGSSLYLKGTVSVTEAHELLQQFLEKYTFKENDGEVIVVKKVKSKVRKKRY